MRIAITATVQTWVIGYLFVCRVVVYTRLPGCNCSVQKVWQLVTVTGCSRSWKMQSANTTPIPSQLGAVSSILRESSGAANSSPSGSHSLPAVSGSAVSTQVTVATLKPLASSTVATSQPLVSSTVVGSSGTLFGSLRHGIEHVGWGYLWRKVWGQGWTVSVRRCYSCAICVCHAVRYK